MIIEQTVEIPAHPTGEVLRLTIEVPCEVPAGMAQVIIRFPVPAEADECPLCAVYKEPNEETIAAFEEGDAMLRGEKPAVWHHSLEDLDKMLGLQSMLAYEFAGSFNKDLKLMKKRLKNIPELREIMRLIINEQPLSERCHNHPLHGKKYEGKRECCYPA